MFAYGHPCFDHGQTWINMVCTQTNMDDRGHFMGNPGQTIDDHARVHRGNYDQVRQ